MARIAVVGATGGLGMNLVRAAVAARHEVRVLVRDARKASFAAGVQVEVGDAALSADVERTAQGCEALFFCVNPAFATWLEAFPPLLAAALDACRRSGAKLVFPANVWVFGKGRAGELVNEDRAHAPCSERGRLRSAMEGELRASGVRFAIARLPEFYGPHVTTLTGPPLARALTGASMVWFGALDAPIELVFMPDGAQALLAIGLAEDGAIYHVPGIQTTARAFLACARDQAQTRGRIVGLSPRWLRALGLVHPLARAAADVAHLWTSPVLLDGARYRARFGAVPQTPYERGVADTLAFLRTHRVKMPY